MTRQAVRICTTHVSPVFLDTCATIDKVCNLIAEAAANGADLIAFPETYVPAFPLWSALQAPIYNHDFFHQLAEQAIRVPGPEVAQVAATAAQHGIFVSLGINEGTDASVGCIWNSNLLFGDDGSILNHHRKLVPTFYEKLTWAAGDGAGLNVVDTRLGRIGMLICGENTNPLARYSLMAQGEQLHIASYPPTWPTHDPGGSPGNYDLAEAIRIRSAAHSFEAKCFTVVSAGMLGDDAYTALAGCSRDAQRVLDGTPRGASMVLDPSGQQLRNSRVEGEELLYADLDIAACIEPKQFHDVAGAYNRFDVFNLHVNRRALRPIHFVPDVVDSRQAVQPWDDGAADEYPTAAPQDPSEQESMKKRGRRYAAST